MYCDRRGNGQKPTRTKPPGQKHPRTIEIEFVRGTFVRDFCTRPTKNGGQRRKSVYNIGGTEIGRIGDNASAEGAKLRLPKARSPLTTRGSGERRKLPLRGLGWSLRSRHDFEHFVPKWSTFYAKMEYTLCQNGVHFMPKWSTFWDQVNLIFSNQIEK